MQNKLEFSDGVFSVKVDGPELDRALKGTVKIVTKNYVIYNRKWLADNIDMEADLVKNHKVLKDESAFNEKCENCHRKNRCALYKSTKKDNSDDNNCIPFENFKAKGETK